MARAVPRVRALLLLPPLLPLHGFKWACLWFGLWRHHRSQMGTWVLHTVAFMQRYVLRCMCGEQA